MDDGSFQWNDAKAARNLALHGVSFEAARLAFQDPFALDWRDDRADYGEERFITLASVDKRILCVVYTERGGATRIISARGAEPHERRRYHANRG
ncbi:BrnT family toxin [Lichenibacterium dinghuense]|uniref:BrnT family toxin n=1 Tax=Lichenibacterium dinghuense TaxID=2895977 RepID=UPI001F40951F|nr:BrnT family toxin [Lichenibacterium sp. 6Y81]